MIAATPLIWDPDVDDHWMFTLDNKGEVATSNGAYQALRGLPRVAGSPNGIAPIANIGGSGPFAPASDLHAGGRRVRHGWRGDRAASRPVAGTHLRSSQGMDA